MTEKRFTIEPTGIRECIVDNTNGEQLDTFDYTERLCELLNDLYEERNYFERKKCEYWNDFNLAHLDNINLRKKNEQLQERNNRQAKRLAELYELMAKKDWESLTEIIDDFKRCEERLQREWKCYE